MFEEPETSAIWTSDIYLVLINSLLGLPMQRPTSIVLKMLYAAIKPTISNVYLVVIYQNSDCFSRACEMKNWIICKYKIGLGLL